MRKIKALFVRFFDRLRPTAQTTQVVQVIAEPESSARAFHDAALQSLNVHLETFDKIDVRVNMALTVGSTILPLTYGLLGLAHVNNRSLTSSCLKVAVFCYLATLFFVFMANSFRAVSYRPSPRTLLENSEDYPDEILLEWVGREYIASVEENAPKLLRKGKWAGGAETTFMLEAISLVFATISALF